MPNGKLDIGLCIPKFLTKPLKVYESKLELQPTSNTNFFEHLNTKNE